MAAIAAAGVERLDDVHHLAAMCSVGILRKCKALVFSEKNFILKKIVLPRQARDKKEGTAQKRSVVFLSQVSAPVRCLSAGGWCDRLQVRKRHSLYTFYMNSIILPRQARDKHGKNSKRAFCRRAEVHARARPRRQ